MFSGLQQGFLKSALRPRNGSQENTWCHYTIHIKVQGSFHCVFMSILFAVNYFKLAPVMGFCNLEKQVPVKKRLEFPLVQSQKSVIKLSLNYSRGAGRSRRNEHRFSQRAEHFRKN